MDDDGELTVKGYLEGEELVLSVTDNGCGMTKERAEALLRGDFVQTGKGSGVGLRNVQERIQLVFGEKYGLRILSEPDEGTCVEIHLPAIPYEEMKEGGWYHDSETKNIPFCGYPHSGGIVSDFVYGLYLEGKKSGCIQYFCHCGYPPGQHQSESAGRCQESGAGIPCGHAFFESP